MHDPVGEAVDGGLEEVVKPEPSGYRAASARSLAASSRVRDSVIAATASFEERRKAAYGEIDAGRWRDWAAAVRSHAATHLDRYLREAETSLIKNGAQVHWALDATEALAVLDGITESHAVRSVVKAKSMLSEELGLNEHLAQRGLDVRETDLGEYIIQLLGESPSHIVGPAIHKSLEECRLLFHERFGTATDARPDELAQKARVLLRDEFLGADLGISGGNFVAADTGTVALIENEGNIGLCTSLPRIHVAFVGIEKVVARFTDLAGLLQLTARAATGQPIGNYVSLIQGPRREDEPEGPAEFHVVFVDNGRADVLADPVAWEALRCVRCGACLNTCPVYRQTGGHAYGWVYSGPIGAILAPAMLGLEEAMPLPFASTLCGGCAEVCPVRIPIPEILRYWRRRAVDAGLDPLAERWAMRGFARMARRPTIFKRASAVLGRFLPSSRAAARTLRALPVLNGWVAEREIPRPCEGSKPRGGSTRAGRARSPDSEPPLRR